MPLIRRAHTIVELLVVLVLGAVIIGMFAHSVTAQRRAERSTVAASARATAADEALQVLSTELARVSFADSVMVRGDTALEWRRTNGIAVACAAGGDTVVVADSGATAWWESPPDSADAAELADGHGAWTRRTIISVRTRSSGGACGVAQRTLRLSAVAPVADLPLVRVMHRVRFALYRASDGAWWLGERACDDATPVHCDAIQPVTGPLAPAPLGVRFALDTTRGARRVSVTITVGRVVRSGTVELRP